MDTSATDWPLLRRMVGMAALGFSFVAGLGCLYVWACPTNSTASSVCGPIQQSPPWTLLSAIAAAPSLLLTWYLRTKQKNAALHVEMEQQRIAQEQQATARFIQSVTLLEKKDERASQLGGIYALERLASDSSAHVGAVVEVLSGYVRERHAIRNELFDEEDHYPHTGENSTIVTRTAVMVLGRLPIAGRGNSRIDLSHTELSGFVFWGNFDNALLDGSVFRDAVFECSLNRASIQAAVVTRADFRRVTAHSGILRHQTDWREALPPVPWGIEDQESRAR